jgi:hypothetical protein
MITKNNSLLAVLFLFLVGLHYSTSVYYPVPNVVPDEFSYLAQARYFAGKAETPEIFLFLQESGLATRYAEDQAKEEISTWPYYHFGYSLFISPAYWFADTPIGAYKGVMLINSVLLSTLFLILFYWLRMISSIEFNYAAMIAFIVSLYPPNVLHAHIGWTENVFIPLFALSCLLLTWHVKKESALKIISFAFVAGFMFAIHPRGLAVSLTAVICLVLFALVDRKHWKNSVLGIFVVVSVVVVTKLIGNDLATLMNSYPSSQANRILKLLQSVGDLNLMSPIFGDIFYLMLSTLGLVVFGMVALIKHLNFNKFCLKSFLQKEQAKVSVYILLACSITFCLGVLYLAQTPEWHASRLRLDWIMYGRYNDGLVSMVMAMGLLWLYQQDAKDFKLQEQTYSRGFLLVALAMLIFIFFHKDFYGLRDIHTYGIFPWNFMVAYTDGIVRMLPLFLGPLFWSWIILSLFMQNKRKGLLIYGVYFLLLDVSLILFTNSNLSLMFD